MSALLVGRSSALSAPEPPDNPVPEGEARRLTLAIGRVHDSNENNAVVTTLGERLIRSGRYEVVNQSRLEEVVKQLGIEQSGLVDPEKAKEVGKRLSVDQLVTADLQRAEIQRSRRGSVSGATVQVGFTAIEIETGKLLLSKSVTAEASAGIFENPSPQDLVSRAISKACGEFVRAYVPETFGKVLEVEANRFIISIGQSHGLGQEDYVKVFRPGKEIVVGGEVVDRRMDEICVGRVVELRGRTCDIVTGSFKKSGPLGSAKWRPELLRLTQVKVGDLVKSIPEEDAKRFKYATESKNGN